MQLIKIMAAAIVLVLSSSSRSFAQTGKKLPSVSAFIKPAAQISRGMFNLVEQDSKFYLVIPDRLLGRDILTTVTIIKGSAQRKRNPSMRYGFAGDAMSDQVIRLRKVKEERIEILVPDFSRASDTANIYYRTLKSELSPALFALNILAADTLGSLIDVTSLFAGDNEFFGLKPAKEELSLGSFEPEKSRIIGASCFENNMVFRSIKSYTAGVPKLPAPAAQMEQSGAKIEPEPTIWELGSSWYLLPEKPMTPRYEDTRVGYFKTEQRDFDRNKNDVLNLAMANRWRIEPKATDVQKFVRGELVEPAKPIIFYIDRNTPAFLIPYIIQGVNAWQQSFEKIGFKNAIVGKLAPTDVEDPNFTMEDARYAYISYKPSEMGNAYGPQVVDPRSGEILSSHVAVFHGILELLQRWYFSMCSAVDPMARQLPFNQQLFGQMLKTVITHEIGHTLGLRHNFIGSACYEVDSIRSPEFVKKHGFGTSIMDYMRFNYVAQPEDGFNPQDLLPKVGVYDDFAIAWGYRFLPHSTDASLEKKELASWVSKKRIDNRFAFTDERDAIDPRVQPEDLGNNSMRANRLGMENLRRTMANLENWTVGGDHQYQDLRSMHRAVQGRYYIYLGTVLKNIGGVSVDNALRSEGKSNYLPVIYQQQKEAMNFLTEFMFTEPQWLYPESIRMKTHFNFNTDVEESYKDLFGRLLIKYIAINKNERLAGKDAYKLSEFFDDLYHATFNSLKSGKPLSAYNRMFQRNFVMMMTDHAKSRASLYGSTGLEMIRILKKVKQEAHSALPLQQDLTSKSHLIALIHFISVWETGKKENLIDNVPVTTALKK